MQNFAHLTVLAVDDDAITLKVIRHLLRDIVAVEVCFSAIEALEIIQRQRIDLILSDMEMPGMSGRELLYRLKAMPAAHDIPFIFLSSIHEQDTWLESLEAGARDFLVKPVEPSLLSAKIKSWLRPIAAPDSLAKSPTGFHLWNLTEALEVSFPGIEQLHVFRQLPNGLLPDAVLFPTENFNLQQLKPLEKVAFQAIRLKIEVSRDAFQLQGAKPKAIDQLGQTLEALFAFKPLLQSEIQEEFQKAVKKTTILQNNHFDTTIGALQIAGFSQSYGGLAGGDFIDQFWLPDGSCLLAIGDVMGKLWGAWFVSMGYLAYLRTLVKAQAFQTMPTFSLVHLMEQLNISVCRDLQLSEVFTTLCLVRILPDGSSIQLVNAGFLPRKGGQNGIERIQIQGTLLGLTYQASYDCLDFNLNPGDIIVIPTDGWAEARNLSSQALVGEDALDQFLLSNKNRIGTASTFIEDFMLHFNINKLSDDASFLWISCPKKTELIYIQTISENQLVRGKIILYFCSPSDKGVKKIRKTARRYAYHTTTSPHRP